MSDASGSLLFCSACFYAHQHEHQDGYAAVFGGANGRILVDASDVFVGGKRTAICFMMCVMMVRLVMNFAICLLMMYLMKVVKRTFGGADYDRCIDDELHGDSDVFGG